MKKKIPLFILFVSLNSFSQTPIGVMSMKQELAKPFYLGEIQTDYSVTVYLDSSKISQTFLQTFEGIKFESMYSKEVSAEDFYKGVRMNKISNQGTYLKATFVSYKNPNNLSFPEGSWLIEIKANP